MTGMPAANLATYCSQVGRATHRPGLCPRWTMCLHPDECQAPDEDQEALFFVAGAGAPAAWPTGGGWYATTDGQRIRGRAKVEQAGYIIVDGELEAQDARADEEE